MRKKDRKERAGGGVAGSGRVGYLIIVLRVGGERKRGGHWWGRAKELVKSSAALLTKGSWVTSLDRV